MKITVPNEFQAARAWQALDVAAFDGVTVRLHWTDQPYKWHVNDGQEVFVVLEGAVRMDSRTADGEASVLLTPGSICHCEEGDEHRAVPDGGAYVLVVERAASV